MYQGTLLKMEDAKGKNFTHKPIKIVSFKFINIDTRL
jgi:hypothetical protein